MRDRIHNTVLNFVKSPLVFYATAALLCLLTVFASMVEIDPTMRWGEVAAEQDSSVREAYATETSSADGEEAASEEGAEEAASVENTPLTERVQALLQYPDLPAGCESVALTTALRAVGFEVDPLEVVGSHLPLDGTGVDFVNSFAGDPYVGGGAYPQAMMRTAQSFFDEHGQGEVLDMSGALFGELVQRVQEGVPVLVWVTMDGSAPAFTGQYFGSYQWYSNEHCVVMYGADNGQVLISDPLQGLVQRDSNEFARLYEACGSMALAIDR